MHYICLQFKVGNKSINKVFSAILLKLDKKEGIFKSQIISILWNKIVLLLVVAKVVKFVIYIWTTGKVILKVLLCNTHSISSVSLLMEISI